MCNIFELTKYELKQSEFKQIVEMMNNIDKTQQFMNQPITFINCEEITKNQLKELNEQEFKNTVALMNNFDKTDQFKDLPINFIDCVEIVDEVDSDNDFEYEEDEEDDEDDEDEEDDEDDEDEQDEEEQIMNYVDVIQHLTLLNNRINYRKASISDVMRDIELLKNILGFERNKEIRGPFYRNPDNSIRFIDTLDGKTDLNYCLFMYVDHFNHITTVRSGRNDLKTLSTRICEKIRRFLYKNT